MDARVKEIEVPKTFWALPHRLGPAANAAIGVIGAGLGAAAASATILEIAPFAVLGGVVGYFLTSKNPE